MAESPRVIEAATWGELASMVAELVKAGEDVRILGGEGFRAEVRAARPGEAQT